MTERGKTILQWVLGIGIAIGAVKIVSDWMHKPPAMVDDTSSKPASSTSASSSTDKPKIALPGSGGATGLPVDGQDARSSPGVRLATMLAQIAKDPKAAKPIGAQQDPSGLVLFQFELPMLDQPVLAIIPERPSAWAWQFGSDVEAADLAPDGKVEPVPGGSPDVASANRILSGPLVGAVLYTIRSDPKLRLLKSAAFIELTSAPDDAPASSSSSSAAPSGSKSARPPH